MLLGHPLKASPCARKLCGQRLQRAQPCRAARAGHDGAAAGRAAKANQPGVCFRACPLTAARAGAEKVVLLLQMALPYYRDGLSHL